MVLEAEEVASLARDDASSLLRTDAETQDLKESGTTGKEKDIRMSRNEARWAIKSYTWPCLDNFTTIEGYKNMFKQQILRAKNEGIPDHAITNSVCTSLLENKRTSEQLNSLAEQYDSTSLEGVLSIIESLESGENSRNATERFHEIAMEESETARSYLGRLKKGPQNLVSQGK